MSRLRRLLDRVRGAGGRAWAGSAEDLLYDGESIEARVELAGDSRVVVTSHRLLAFTPEGGGENYRGVDRPNVADVRPGYEGERNLLGQGARTMLYGVVVLAVGVFVDFGSIVPTDAFQQSEATGQLGMAGLLGLLERFLSLIARIDEFARIVGALLVLFAVFVFAVYLLTRDRVLVVDVAGDGDPIRVPADDARLDGAVADLEVVLFGSGAATGADAAETGATEPSPGDADPLSSASGAVHSEGISGVEGTASSGSEGADDPADAVERAVRETRQADFSEAVDEVVEGSDADAE